MKLKQIIIILFLVIISGIIFYFGWIQIKLPKNTYGIAFTKSSGYLNKLYEPGKFSWSPSKLIPGNFELSRFVIIPQQLEISEKGELPSGSVYSEYLPGKPDFSYEFDYYITYIINLTNFPKIVSDLKLTPDQLGKKYNELNADIQLYISNFYKSKAVDSNSTLNSFYNSTELSQELTKLLSSKFPQLDFLDFVPSYIKIPDAILYTKAKGIYLTSIELQNKVLSESKIKVAEQEILDNANFETLKKYGELLNDYPSLIELFSVIDFNSETMFPKLNIELPEEISN